MAAEELAFPPLTKADILACRFSSWYPTFRKVSPKATIISPLDDAFVDYLEADGVFLPEGSGPIGVSELSDDDEDAANGSDNHDDMSWQFKFPELDAHIRRVILKYEGAVFPKLNWSSPQDAAWMLPGSTVRCQSPADVYLLLKSSDFITHDLDHAFDGCVDYLSPSPSFEPELPNETTNPISDLTQSTSTLVIDSDSEENSDESSSDETRPSASARRKEKPYDFELVLKKWFEMPRSQEWRCFVRENQLVAISQRDPNYYSFLQSSSTLDEIKTKMSEFFTTEIQSKFPSSFYTFDVYFTRSNERVFLIDFNPYAPQTDSLLIPWETIHALQPPSEGGSVRIEIVREEGIGSSAPVFAHNRYPKDVVDLSSGASIAEFAKKWRTALEEGVLGSDGESTTGSTRSIPGR